jgi:cold shock CspA family protein
MEQYCRLCSKLFDLERGDFQVIRPLLHGVECVLDKSTGAIHELLSVKRTQTRIEKQQKAEQKVIVRLVEKVLETAPAATPAIIETPEPKPPKSEPVVVTEEPYHAEEPFVPQAEDWWNVLIVSVCSRGFARGIIGGEHKGTPVFIHMKNVRMASGSEKPENLKTGQWLACQIVPSDREDSAFQFEATDAVIEDLEEEKL